jgi:cytochrome c biogenesis protein CcdA/glutaredoxin-related protein
VLSTALEVGAQEKPVVRFYLFYGEICAHCHEVMDNFLPYVYAKYGDQVQYQYVEVFNNADNYLAFVTLERELGVSDERAGNVPALVIGDQVLIGSGEIPSMLETYIDRYLAEGGVGYYPIEELDVPVPVPQPIKEVHIAYFDKAGCQECARVNYDLRAIENRYDKVIVARFPMEQDENTLLNEWLCEKYDVPEGKRLSTPMVFVGEDVFIGDEVNLDSLQNAVAKYASTGAKPTWNEFNPDQAEQSLLERFRSCGVLVILGAGLIDGLNPCAFATLVFFISYMTFTGCQGRDILFVGVAFALGVFLTYLLVGIGVLNLIQSLEFFPSLGRWVYVVTALLCVVLAILTFRDFFRARRGQATEMTLKLPTSLRKRINGVIRKGAQVRAFAAMALVTGFVVSLIELACTGQIYLPTIQLMVGQPELAGRAFFYLVLYCLAFVAPLVVVFLLSYFGTTSEQLGLFIARHIATIKVVTALVFVGLALWMTWALAPLFGINAPGNWWMLGGVVVVIGGGAMIAQVSDSPTSRRPVNRRASRRRKVRRSRRRR